MKIEYFFKNLDESCYSKLFENKEYPIDVLNELNNYVSGLVGDSKINNGEMGEFVSISGNYFIGYNTKIHSNVTIEGPVYIGDNVEIMSGALIRPYSLIGNGVVVGHSCEVKHSIILDKAKVQSFTFIGDSIIGYKTRIGSGTILVNRRFDQGNISLKVDGLEVDLKNKFFGSVIGDNTRLGANVTCYPGTFIGRNTWIYPGCVVKGFIPSLKRISIKNDYYITDNKEYELN